MKIACPLMIRSLAVGWLYWMMLAAPALAQEKADQVSPSDARKRAAYRQRRIIYYDDGAQAWRVGHSYCWVQ